MFFLIFPGTGFAQITFQKGYGDTIFELGYSVQQTLDGGYIMAGVTNSMGAGGYDVYLLKTNEYGNLQWTKTFGGSGNDGSAVYSDPFTFSVQVTTDGGYIISGHTSSFGAGLNDIYILKTDSTGNLLWSETFGSTYDDYGCEIRQTTDGGYMIAGCTNNTGWQAQLIKIDSSGYFDWANSYAVTFDGFMALDLQQTTDGGYIFTGAQEVDATSFRDVSLVKTDQSGNILWGRTYGGVYSEEGHAVQQTNDGGYIISGVTNSFGSGVWDVYLLKTDSSGNLLWSKTFGGQDDDWAYSVEQTPDGGYMVAGNTASFGAAFNDSYLIKTDSTGNLLWSKTFGGSYDEFSSCARQTSDGGFLLMGTGMKYLPEIHLVKTDSTGHSGCNESNAAFITTTPATVATIPAYTIITGITTGNPATLTGSGGTMTNLCSSTGINSIDPAAGIFVFPVPANNEIMIELSSSGIIRQTEIYNLQGQKLISSAGSGKSEQKINITDLASGIYFVSVFDGEKYYCMKLMVD